MTKSELETAWRNKWRIAVEMAAIAENKAAIYKAALENIAGFPQELFDEKTAYHLRKTAEYALDWSVLKNSSLDNPSDKESKIA